MRILYATDGSRAANAGLAVVEKLADRQRTSIDVVSVIPDVPEPGTDEVSGATSVVEAAVDRLVAAGFRADGDVARGAPAPTIIDRSEGHDLILVGAGDKDWLGRMLLGSVSSAVLHAAACSVLIVHRPPGGAMPAPVVLGTDGSSDAILAAHALTELVPSDACIVHVLGAAAMPTPIVGVGSMGYATATYSTELETALREAAEGNVRRTTETLRAEGYQVQEHVAKGSAGPMILEYAESIDADLVVVGSRGLGTVGRLVVGSVSDTVARHARASLVVRSSIG
jgi:nucleotide-binding universal stress UspA family protein